MMLSSLAVECCIAPAASGVNAGRVQQILGRQSCPRPWIAALSLISLELASRWVRLPPRRRSFAPPVAASLKLSSRTVTLGFREEYSKGASPSFLPGSVPHRAARANDCPGTTPSLAIPGTAFEMHKPSAGRVAGRYSHRCSTQGWGRRWPDAPDIGEGLLSRWGAASALARLVVHGLRIQPVRHFRGAQVCAAECART